MATENCTIVTCIMTSDKGVVEQVKIKVKVIIRTFNIEQLNIELNI